MRSISLKRNKKGVSPIIATLLLIVIAVAAAVVTYAFVTGFIGTATSQSNQQGAMSIDTGSVVANGTSGSTITVYVRNTGTKSENLTTVYVDNNLITSGTNGWTSFNGAAFASIAPNAVCTVIIYSPVAGPNWADAAAHTVKVLATDGTPVAYSVHS